MTTLQLSKASEVKTPYDDSALRSTDEESLDVGRRAGPHGVDSGRRSAWLNLL